MISLRFLLLCLAAAGVVACVESAWLGVLVSAAFVVVLLRLFVRQRNKDRSLEVLVRYLGESDARDPRASFKALKRLDLEYQRAARDEHREAGGLEALLGSLVGIPFGNDARQMEQRLQMWEARSSSERGRVAIHDGGGLVSVDRLIELMRSWLHFHGHVADIDVPPHLKQQEA